MRRPLVFLVFLAACSRGEHVAADDSTLATIDTLKPATTDSAGVGALVDSVGRSTSPTAPAGSKTGTQSTAPSSSSKTPPRDTTNIGRDRAIKPNPNLPRIPVVDTTKRPAM